MIVFSVTSLQPNPKLDAAAREQYPDHSLQVNSTTWLIAATGTAKEVSDKLKISEGEVGGTAVVFSTSGYFGRAPSNIWEWIKAKREAADA